MAHPDRIQAREAVENYRGEHKQPANLYTRKLTAILLQDDDIIKTANTHTSIHTHLLKERSKLLAELKQDPAFPGIQTLEYTLGKNDVLRVTLKNKHGDEFKMRDGDPRMRDLEEAVILGERATDEMSALVREKAGKAVPQEFIKETTHTIINIGSHNYLPDFIRPLPLPINPYEQPRHTQAAPAFPEAVMVALVEMQQGKGAAPSSNAVLPYTIASKTTQLG